MQVKESNILHQYACLLSLFNFVEIFIWHFTYTFQIAFFCTNLLPLKTSLFKKLLPLNFNTLARLYITKPFVNISYT